MQAPAFAARRPACDVARSWVLLALIVSLSLVAACSSGDGRPETTAAETTSLPPGEPGTLVEAEPIDAPAGARAWRITYHSQSVDGRDVAATGRLVVPDGPAPAGGLPVVGWGHSTTGSADACAPSAGPIDNIPVLDEVLDRGWALVEADYLGLGTDEPHPYLVGVAEGWSVLDAIRAASSVDGSGVEPSSPVLLWGFSQGGHAVLFAAELGLSYAPELDLRGVAVSAPVADAAQFWARAAAQTDQLGVTVSIAAGMAAAYPELDLSEVLTDETIAELAVLDELCIGEVNGHFDRPIDEVLAGSYADSASWSRRLAENLTARRQLGYPVLVTQGDADEIVFPEVSAALADRLCGHGDVVELRTVAGAGHGDLPPGPTADWLEERLTGIPPNTTCP